MEERIILTHEIMTKGRFYSVLDDGTEIEVFGQCHTLVKISQYFEDGEWYDNNREEIDGFYLTGYEEGYLYDGDDLCRLFDIEDAEWDYNGDSNNWCGIEDEDEDEVCQKKWIVYKSKFSKISSKEQFYFLKP